MCTTRRTGEFNNKKKRMFKLKGSPAIAHHLISYEPLRKESQSQTTCVCFHFTSDRQLICDSEHPDGRLFSLQLKPHEKALILYVKLVYCKNNTGQDVPMCLELFRQEEREGKHPDHTGKVHFVAHHRAPGVIPKQDRVLYEPNLFNLGINILPYAGTEHSILQARSTVVYSAPRGGDDFLLFHQSDPFIVFLLEHASAFPEIQKSSDIVLVEKKTTSVYKVAKHVVERVKQFFERAVFPLFRYVEGDYLQLSWNPSLKDDTPSGECGDGFAMIKMLISIEYIVIAPEVPKFHCSSVELGI